ncbi:MAG: LpqB family beta-propeller domain-containing protein, partial [Myxococcota bacterium]
ATTIQSVQPGTKSGSVPALSPPIKTELFTVAPTGLGNTKISGALLDVSDVRSFQWSPDSTRIAFRADGEVDQVVELYVVDPDGADRVRLTTGIEFDEDGVIEFAWSPASSTLAFTVADVDVNSLYRVGGDGSALQTIATAVEGAAPIDFQWSSDGRSLAYRAAQVTADESGLFVSPVDGAPVVQIADRSSAFSWRY